MDILLFAFANDRKDPLPTLTDEYLSINKILAPRVLRQHFLAWALSHATLEEVAFYLTLFRDSIKLFQFSGHAGRDQLFLEDGVAQAKGIAHLLGQCQNLQAVILNGCSTRGQVEVLHEAGVPLVIATSAPVNDDAATRFAKRLLQALETGQNIETAFELACGEVLAKQKIRIWRDVRAISRDEEEGVWGIFLHPEKGDAGKWMLPTRPNRVYNTRYQPNELLLETLFETFARTNIEVKSFWEADKNLDENRGDVIFSLLKALPAPLSEQVRKLVKQTPPGERILSYDSPGIMRLEQMAQTYQITMDFMVFAMISQIWEISYSTEWNTPEVLRKTIKSYLHLKPQERQDFDYFSFIGTLHVALSGHHHDLFIQEFGSLDHTFLDDEAVKNACFFLETLRRQIKLIGALDMIELCERAEDALSTIFSRLGYLGKYILATIRNIDVQKYRFKQEAQFEHLVMKWHGLDGNYDKEFRRQREFMDNRSVVLLRWEENDRNNRFLNLSPFVLDENTFEKVPDTSLSKLYFFTGFNDEKLY